MIFNDRIIDNYFEILGYIYEEEVGTYRKIGFDDNHEIIKEYCNSCLKKENCSENKALLSVNIQNKPHNSSFFVPVYIFNKNETMSEFSKSQPHVYCDQYSSPQKKLFVFKDYKSEGLERLVEISKQFF